MKNVVISYVSRCLFPSILMYFDEESSFIKMLCLEDRLDEEVQGFKWPEKEGDYLSAPIGEIILFVESIQSKRKRR